MNKLGISIYFFTFLILQSEYVSSIPIKTDKMQLDTLLKYEKKNLNPLVETFKDKMYFSKVNQKNKVNEIDKKNSKTNRLLRFILSFLLVLIFVIAVFILVKNSVDWATSGRGEINKFYEQKKKQILEMINQEFSM